MRRVIDKLRILYEGDTQEAHRFRYGLLVFDIATTVFIVASSFPAALFAGARTGLRPAAA